MSVKKLYTINEYRKIRFVSKAPDPRTIRKMIDEGEIAGKRMGRIYYVELMADLSEIDGITGGVHHG